MRGRARLSLKARAIALLAQREHSRSELRAKLIRHAQAAARDEDPNVADTDARLEAARSTASAAEEIDSVLDWLERQGHLSDRRFSESRIRVRAPRHGAERIRRELARHGVSLEPQALQALRETEFERASHVWQRKFGAAGPDAAADAETRARQARFLAQRGFAADVIQRVIRGTEKR